ncbi:hypothetical protein EVB27_065 [Rhizobium phage RHph_TM16]|nr:hypothetical protein EVB27_065 [Rhizobium phage RHph_TM16]
MKAERKEYMLASETDVASGCGGEAVAQEYMLAKRYMLADTLRPVLRPLWLVVAFAGLLVAGALWLVLLYAMVMVALVRLVWRRRK